MKKLLAAFVLAGFALAPAFAQEKKSQPTTPTTEEVKKADAKKDGKSEAKKTEAKKKVKKGGC